jgi:hypothetical protein
MYEPFDASCLRLSIAAFTPRNLGPQELGLMVCAQITSLQGYTRLGQLGKMVGLVGYNTRKGKGGIVQTLLDNSILIIFMVLFLALTILKFRTQMERFNLTFKELFKVRYENLKLELPDLYLRLTASVVYTLFASLIVFRTLWSTPAFHTVILCMITHNLVLSISRRIL